MIRKALTAASAALAISLAIAAPTQAAVVYDAVGDFYSTSAEAATSVWSYGWNRNNEGFVAFNSQIFNKSGDICADGLSCWYQNDNVIYSVPMVAKNVTSDQHTLAYADTVVHPADVLNLHPGVTLDGSNLDVDAIVRFTAATSSTYKFSGFFKTLDNNPSGVSILAGGDVVDLTGAGKADVTALTTGAPVYFDDSVYLAAGQTLDFRVNRAGAIWNDSTGLSLQITAVPEPASWALMIVGFGAAGALLRSRRRMLAA